MRNDRERLLDILEAISRIEKYTAQGREAFDRDELIQNWIVSHIQVIGEAARGLSDRFRASNSDLPWPDIIGMRNVLVHHYFGIDPDIVWAVVVGHIPNLKKRVEVILGELKE